MFHQSNRPNQRGGYVADRKLGLFIGLITSSKGRENARCNNRKYVVFGELWKANRSKSDYSRFVQQSFSALKVKAMEI